MDSFTKFTRNAKPSYVRKFRQLTGQLLSGEKSVWQLGKRLGRSRHSSNAYFSVPIGGSHYRLVVQLIENSVKILAVLTHQDYDKYIKQLP